MGTFLGQVISEFVLPTEVPIWQLAMFVNALLLYITVFFAKYQKHLIQEGIKVSSVFIQNTMSTMLVIRKILTVYVCMCSLYIVGRLVLDINLPSLGTELFPWQ